MTFYSRKSPRIPDYDYSNSGYYFVTICTHDKKSIFGKPDKLNQYGKITWHDLSSLEKHCSNVKVDIFAVMPNHIHAIIVIDHQDGSTDGVNLNTIVGQYKSGVTRKIREICPDLSVWQRSYHDHIIRNEKQYQKIWEYIHTNPLRWMEDCFYVKD